MGFVFVEPNLTELYRVFTEFNQHCNSDEPLKLPCSKSWNGFFFLDLFWIDLIGIRWTVCWLVLPSFTEFYRVLPV